MSVDKHDRNRSKIKKIEIGTQVHKNPRIIVDQPHDDFSQSWGQFWRQQKKKENFCRHRHRRKHRQIRRQRFESAGELLVQCSCDSHKASHACCRADEQRLKVTSHFFHVADIIRRAPRAQHVSPMSETGIEDPVAFTGVMHQQSRASEALPAYSAVLCMVSVWAESFLFIDVARTNL